MCSRNNRMSLQMREYQFKVPLATPDELLQASISWSYWTVLKGGSVSRICYSGLHLRLQRLECWLVGPLQLEKICTTFQHWARKKNMARYSGFNKSPWWFYAGTNVWWSLFPSGPLCSMCVNRFGCRPVMLVGGLFASAGMITASFCNSIFQVYVTVGVITGK